MLSIPCSEKFFPSLREWQLSGTPENVEHHEAHRKDFHFCNDSLRDKTVQLSIMEQNTYSQSDSRLFLKVTLGIYLVSINQ
jgi:hypothetical protein